MRDNTSHSSPDIGARHPGALGWLLLAVAALGLSAAMALLLVAARTPGVATLLAGRIAFAEALVLHVNLSVLVWCLALAGLLWVWRRPVVGRLGDVPLGMAGGGALLMLLSPLVGGTTPVVLSNYVPVLDQSAFLVGLALFAAGMAAAAARFVVLAWPRRWPTTLGAVLDLGLCGVAISVLMAGAVLLLALAELPRGLPVAVYYERLFWGAGHVLQLAYAQLLGVVWLWLAAQGGGRWALPSSHVAGWLLAGWLPTLAALVIAVALPVLAPRQAQAFTLLMVVGGWWLLLPALAIGLRGRRAVPLAARLTLALSLGLYLLGALLGSLIRGDTLLVPAHYHAVTGAVTLALMGGVYTLLPHLGGRRLATRLKTWQLGLYASGVALMALGLAWSGIHGGVRKTPGAPVDEMALAGMAMMGVGGMAAIVGVFGFVALLWLALGARRGVPAALPQSPDGKRG
ncbi:cbb3-type cytochrome c oxidase subunit I [Halomonas sp. DQ26W]|uniref:cbb3-type cytochrome c oxidase subunit I n=1 Tax=Halomonas sp. DQ26W TaxID=2282311 RepID=UPI0015F104E0|nr:cbb3-type cytochrome c oxidase subunit I [Halomonas sp. DQ26W]